MWKRRADANPGPHLATALHCQLAAARASLQASAPHKQLGILARGNMKEFVTSLLLFGHGGSPQVSSEQARHRTSVQPRSAVPRVSKPVLDPDAACAQGADPRVDASPTHRSRLLPAMPRDSRSGPTAPPGDQLPKAAVSWVTSTGLVPWQHKEARMATWSHSPAGLPDSSAARSATSRERRAAGRSGADLAGGRLALPAAVLIENEDEPGDAVYCYANCWYAGKPALAWCCCSSSLHVAGRQCY